MYSRRERCALPPTHNETLTHEYSRPCGPGEVQRRYSFKVTDKKASKEVCRNKSAAPSRAEVKKRLVSDDALQPLKNAIQAARDYHEENTLPWSGLGDILRNDKFLEYTQNMRRLTAAIDAAKEDFLAEYPSLREAAESALGDLYSPLDFPPVEKICKGIYHKITVLPIPSGADFRLQLTDLGLAQPGTR